MARVCAGLFVVVSGAATLLGFAGMANASGTRCENAVLSDWSDNGRIDRFYPLRCYRSALDAMPTDLRDYTNAGDVIRRALASAVSTEGVRKESPAKFAAGNDPQLGQPASSTIPLPLVALTAISLAVLAAGGLGYVSRRRRAGSGRPGT
jgi:hypothetical protein